MDFVELETIEGLRWSWNSWPVSKSEAAALVIPLSIMCTPLMQFNELPLLPYDPLICNLCGAVLNPYARVDYQSRIWVCPFCYRKNLFPRSYAGIGENNLPAELFPTYSTVEYQLSKKLSNPGSNLNLSNNWGNRFLSSNPSSNLNLSGNLSQIGNKVENLGSNLNLSSSWGNGLGSNSNNNWGSGLSPSASLSPAVSSSSLVSSFSSASVSGLDLRGVGPAFVFVVDVSSSEAELRALKNELLHVVSQLPESALVGLVTFDSMVRVHDLGFTECLRVVVLHGERELSSDQVIN